MICTELNDYLAAIASQVRTIGVSDETSGGELVCGNIDAEDKEALSDYNAQLSYLKKYPNIEELDRFNSDMAAFNEHLFAKCRGLDNLQKAVEEMFEAFPHLANLKRAELEALIMSAIASQGKQSDCEALCAVDAALTIGIIEGIYVGAMIACASTTVAYWICAGIATGVKQLAVAKMGVNLVQCLQACQDNGESDKGRAIGNTKAINRNV